MTVPLRHLLAQGPVLAALGEVALTSIIRRRRGAAPPVPGPWIEAEVPPRPAALVRDYVLHVGGDPAAYAASIPPHLFPQWSFPLAAKALAELPYPLTRVINAGARIEVRAPLPAGEVLFVKARLESIDDDGRRARVTQRIVTGTRSSPEAVTAELRTHIPLSRGGGKSHAKTATLVPEGAPVIGNLDIDARAGLDFALLTGDVNPIHWLPPAAKAAGFRGMILHGFATMARAWESVVRAKLGGDPGRIAAFEARFVKPLHLPGRAVVATQGDEIWVGERLGGDAYLEGRLDLR